MRSRLLGSWRSFGCTVKPSGGLAHAESLWAMRAGGTPVSVREIADTVQELIGRVPVHYVPARDADYPGVSVSNRAAKELLDWSPATPFAAGVRRYLDWLGWTNDPPAGTS